MRRKTSKRDASTPGMSSNPGSPNCAPGPSALPKRDAATFMSEPVMPVVVPRRFERAFGALLDHCEALRHLHPDAGTRAWQWVEAIESRMPQLLGAQPNIGCREALLCGIS